MATRAAQLDHVFDVLEFSDEVRDYLRVTLGARSAGRLASIREPDLTAAMASEVCPLTVSDVIEILKFRLWYKAWADDEEETRTLAESLTNDVWDRVVEVVYHDGDDVTVGAMNPPAGDGSTVDQGLSTRGYVRMDLRQFRRFNGGMSDWVKCKRHFMATMRAMGLGEMVSKDFVPPEEGDPGYAEYLVRSNFMHAGLTHITMEGTAYRLVERYKESGDGFHAWLDLMDWFEGQGNNENIADRSMRLLAMARFDRKTPGGCDGYLNFVEAQHQNLREVDHPYDTTLSKITLLHGIQHPDYEVVRDQLMSDPDATYDDCILKLRKRAIDLELLNPQRRQLRPVREVYATNAARGNPRMRNPQQRGQGRNGNRPADWKEDHVWAQMTVEERRDHIRQRNDRRRRNNGRQQLPNQYGGQPMVNHVSRSRNAPNDNGARVRPAQVLNVFRNMSVNYVYTLHATEDVTNAVAQGHWNSVGSNPITIVDSGADISVLGAGWIPVGFTGDYVDLSWVFQTEVPRLPIVDAIAVVGFSEGQYRYAGVHNAAWLGPVREDTEAPSDFHHTSILSANQARRALNVIDVDDRPMELGGAQRITVAVDEYVYPDDTVRVEDYIHLDVYGNLTAFTVATESIKIIIAGMNREEFREIIPDDRVHWLTSPLPYTGDTDRMEALFLNKFRGDGLEYDAFWSDLEATHFPGGRFDPHQGEDHVAIGTNNRFLPDEFHPHAWMADNMAEHMVADMVHQDMQRVDWQLHRGVVPIVDNGAQLMMLPPVPEINDVDDDDEDAGNYVMVSESEPEMDWHMDWDMDVSGASDDDVFMYSDNNETVVDYARPLASLLTLVGNVNTSSNTETLNDLPVPPSTSEEHSLQENDPEVSEDATTGIRENVRRNINYETMKPKLGWLPIEVVEKTFKATTQLAKRTRDRLPFRRHYKSRYPELNRKRLRETFATDTFFSSSKALGGYMCMQLFVGLYSRFTATYGMKTESDGPEALEDFIRQYGAPFVLRSDNAKMEIGHAFTKICRKYNVKQTTTEPHHPQQNPAERQIQEVKKRTNMIMDRTGCPEEVWYLVVQYVVYLLNRTATEALKWKTPWEVAFGETPDISNLIQFEFWELVYYHNPAESFPDSKERLGRFVGIAENIGDFMTYYVLIENGEVLARSSVRSAGKDLNLRILDDAHHEGSINGGWLESKPRTFAGEEKGEIEDRVLSLNDMTNIGKAPMVQDPEDIIGFKYVGEFRGIPVTKTITEYDPVNEEYKLELANGLEETIRYSTIIDLFNRKEEDTDRDGVWSYEKIIGHRKEGSRGKWEVEVLWSNGETTWEPLSAMKKDDPLTLAVYARERELLDLDGWKWAKTYTTDPKKMIRIVRRVMAATRKKNKKHGPKYKFGVRVPNNVRDAFAEDQANGNTLWAEAMQKEVAGLNEFDTFRALDIGAKPPDGYTFVPLHWCYDVKFDGRRRARLVASGNWTEPLSTDAYSGVVSIDTIRIAFLLGELNGLTVIATDISQAYLHGKTQEKVYSRAGPEFGELQGRILIIEKGLYGLRGSSYAWHAVLADFLRSLGWRPSYADADLWILDCGTHYEYIATWVDDLLIWSKEPMKLIKQLEAKFHLKGTGVPEYYLGGDIEQIKWVGSPTGTAIALSSRTYITNVCEKIEKMFEIELRHYGSPMDPLYHPEVDDTELLPPLSIPKYQMLVGCANWVVTLGRFDVYYAVSTMARFNVAPREGHLKAMFRIFGYLKHYRKWRTIVDPTPPVRSHKNEEDGKNWTDLYPEAEEEIPPNMPEPKGKTVSLTLYKDADGGSDLVTRKSITGILGLANSFPVKSYSKRQATVETSTYGSELVAARIAVDLLVELRYKLRMLGAPIETPSVMYGDNMSVVLSTTFPSSTLKKKHLAIAWHRVREAVAAGIVTFVYVPSVENISDCLTKSLSPMVYSKLVKPFFTRGTARTQGECQDDGEPEPGPSTENTEKGTGEDG